MKTICWLPFQCYVTLNITSRILLATYRKLRKRFRYLLRNYVCVFIIGQVENRCCRKFSLLLPLSLRSLTLSPPLPLPSPPVVPGDGVLCRSTLLFSMFLIFPCDVDGIQCDRDVLLQRKAVTYHIIILLHIDRPNSSTVRHSLSLVCLNCSN